METITKKDQETLTIELANAIASFKIDKVAELLSEKGEYCTLDEKTETVIVGKASFIDWLSKCFASFLSTAEGKGNLKYTIDQCLHCRIGNPVIIFENGTFPIKTMTLADREKCGLMLEFDDNLVCGITFCFVFLHTENPFLFERKKCSRHLD